MSLRSILAYPFGNWFRPVAFAAVTLPVSLLCMPTGIGILELTGSVLFFVAGLWLFASLIYLLFKGEWKKFFATLLIIIAIVIAIGLTAGGM